MSEQPKARIAFIGCGGFASNRAMPNIPWIPEIEFVAACDIVRERAEQAQRRWGAKRVYTDLEQMLDKEQLDGVFVIGPAPQQYELAPRVLRRGIPVYVEKPSANTAAQAQELADIARQHNTWGQVGFMKRFSTAYTLAGELIAREEFGSLNMIVGKFSQGPYPDLWGMEAKRAFLVGQNVHLCDLVQFFAGPARRVHALFKEVEHELMGYLANIEFQNGIIGQLNFNTLEAIQPWRDFDERLELIGTGCMVQVDDGLYVEVQGGRDWTRVPGDCGKLHRQWRPTGPAARDENELMGYLGEIRHFARKCIGLAEGGPELEDCVRALKLAEAIYDSACGAKVVEIS